MQFFVAAGLVALLALVTLLLGGRSLELLELLVPEAKRTVLHARDSRERHVLPRLTAYAELALALLLVWLGVLSVLTS